MDINNVVVAGRLTKDPDLRYTPSGNAVVRFTIASNRRYKNAQGEREADFVNCIAWRKTAENIANLFKKGDGIGVTGGIQTGSFEGQDGKRVYTTDILVDNFSFGQKVNGSNENRSNNGPTNQSGAGASTRVEQDPFYNGSGPIEVSDDDLPF